MIKQEESASSANLPPLLKKVVEVFNDPKERLLVLYSTIVILSGIMTRVRGTYRQNTTYPNLFFIAIAPAASSKGSMMYSKQLLNPISEFFIKDSRRKMDDYKRMKKRDRNAKGPPPGTKVVFIPANSSTSKIYQHLADNGPDTPTAMIESEADSVTQAHKTEHGNYSDFLRKAFHNEPCSLSRRKDNEYINIPCPKLAVALSGTPGQLMSFINNREDGLLSRFLVMYFKSSTGWKNVGPCPGCINLTDYFDRLSEDFFKLWEFISQKDLVVDLSQSQWDQLNDYCASKYEQICKIHGEDATSLIKRHGLMIFKICMVLTSLRNYEDQEKVGYAQCADTDLSLAMFLVDKSLDDALELYQSLPEIKAANINNKTCLYNTLSDEFTRSEAIEIGKSLSIAERSTDRYLKEFVIKNLLQQRSKGNYKKVQVNNNSF